MSESRTTEPELPLWLALLPMIVLTGLLGGAVYLFGDGSSSGPNQISLFLVAGIAVLIGLRRGIPWPDLEEALVDGIRLALKACLILLMIGSLIGAWMLSGTAPAMIHLGLGLLDPAWFYPAVMVICALVAVTIGSSWTTAGTVGVAIIGVSNVLGLSPAITAGAVISGAYFGDKLSPLSDTTNLAPAMVDAELFAHIRNLLWTTMPAFAIAFVLFGLIAMGSHADAADSTSIAETRALLATHYRLGIPAYLPLLLVLGLAIRRFPAFPTIAFGALFGGLIAIVYQPDAVRAFADPEGSLPKAAMIAKALWTVLADGYVAKTGNAALDELLTRGGMSSMLNTVWLIFSAMTFGAAMEKAGLIHRIVTTLLTWVRGTGSLIATTVLTSIGMNLMAADQYIAIVVPGRMFRLEFKRRGLAPLALSRTLEDAGTMTSPLIPWNTCGAFMSATLGVPTLVYAPYAFLNLLSPLIAILYGIFNVKIVRLGEQPA
ncbi:MAG: Na+/H+ antiporter NhaC [Rhodothalassiaceae bacterium]